MIPGYKRFNPARFSANPATIATPVVVGSGISEVSNCPLPTEWDYQIADWPPERAAIIQYDANFSRAEAERLAGMK